MSCYGEKLLNPKVFLSHSRTDKALAERLARDLTASGVDVWYAEWEIAPGDSLRRKIDAGIEGASHFLVLLTPNSLKSEWVQTELDAGMVRRINGHCKLIPIVHEIRDEEVPATLAGILWVRLEEADYTDGLRKLLDACHGVSRKPVVGPVPLWAQRTPLPNTGLSIHAQRLAALLNERSETGREGDPSVDIQDAQQALELVNDEIDLAVAELLKHDLVALRTDGNCRGGIRSVSPTARLFFETDLALRGWNPAADARAVAAAAVNANSDTVRRLDELDQLLSWGPRRLNPAAHYLVMHDGVESEPPPGAGPYAYRRLAIGAKTRLFALGS